MSHSGSHYAYCSHPNAVIISKDELMDSLPHGATGPALGNFLPDKTSDDGPYSADFMQSELQLTRWFPDDGGVITTEPANLQSNSSSTIYYGEAESSYNVGDGSTIDETGLEWDIGAPASVDSQWGLAASALMQSSVEGRSTGGSLTSIMPNMDPRSPHTPDSEVVHTDPWHQPFRNRPVLHSLSTPTYPPSFCPPDQLQSHPTRRPTDPGSLSLQPMAEFMTPAADEPLVKPICWVGQCGKIIEGVDHKGIENHIAAAHSEVLTKSGTEMYCPWHPADKATPCNRELKAISLVKHIASVHLKCTSIKCHYCGASVSRRDALLRHQRRDCRRIPAVKRCQLLDQYMARRRSKCRRAKISSRSTMTLAEASMVSMEHNAREPLCTT